MARQKTSGTSRSKRILLGLLSIILPIQETKWYLRASRHITSRNFERMNKALSDFIPPEEPLQEDKGTFLQDDKQETGWASAVAASGRTPAQLEAGYLARRRDWRIIFWVMAVPVPLILLLPLYHGNGFTLHQASTCLVFISGAGIAWSRALIAAFRLWQLRNRRVSLAERGTFRHFLAENHLFRAAVTDRRSSPR